MKIAVLVIVFTFTSCARLDIETGARLLEAYFCTGDPNWPLGINSSYPDFRASVILGHFLVCSQLRDFPVGYRNNVIDAIKESAKDFLLPKTRETRECMYENSKCLLYEHLCGEEKIWELRSAATYLRYCLRNSADDGIGKAVLTLLDYLLQEGNIESFLSLIEPACPQSSSSYCNGGHPHKRDLADESLTKLVGDVRLVRRKRVFDPVDMMQLFNKLICNEAILELLVEYYDKKGAKLRYSRSWTVKTISGYWCCLAKHLEYHY